MTTTTRRPDAGHGEEAIVDHAISGEARLDRLALDEGVDLIAAQTDDSAECVGRPLLGSALPHARAVVLALAMEASRGDVV